jgi:hypothetical protein
MTGAGGNLIVALEAARNINLDDVVVSTQVVDLLDIEKMIEKFGGMAYGEKPLGTEEKEILRGKTEREDFFRLPRRMPEGLKVPEELEKELKETKPVVPEELQDKINEEWESLTEEYPVSQ